jgi:glutamate racemase
MTDRSIAIIDSGIGGLSVFHAIKKIMPDQNIIYCCDSAGFPYGHKDKKNIISRIKYCIEKLLKSFDLSLIVIACNTASIHTLEVIRKDYKIKIVGVVPAIKTAGALSQNRHIGLLATPQTVASDYVETLIQQFLNDCHVFKIGSSKLVKIAESRICLGIEPEISEIKEIIQPFLSLQNTPDVIVLGCTHFAFITDLLIKATPKKITWIEPSVSIANRVNTLISIQKNNAASKGNAFVSTCNSKYNTSFISYLNNIGFQYTYSI